MSPPNFDLLLSSSFNSTPSSVRFVKLKATVSVKFSFAPAALTVTAHSALSSFSSRTPSLSASTNAVIVTLPTATPVTLPSATVAFASSEDFQATFCVALVGELVLLYAPFEAVVRIPLSLLFHMNLHYFFLVYYLTLQYICTEYCFLFCYSC